MTKTVWDWVLLNDSKAIWLRSSSEIEPEEYSNFYKALSKDKSDPLTYPTSKPKAMLNLKLFSSFRKVPHRICTITITARPPP